MSMTTGTGSEIRALFLDSEINRITEEIEYSNECRRESYGGTEEQYAEWDKSQNALREMRDKLRAERKGLEICSI